MKFKNYLNEMDVTENEFNILIRKLKKECKPFINDIKRSKPDNLLYSGRSEYPSNKLFFEKKIRNDRRPLNSSPLLQKKLDDVFYDIFKVRPRASSIFTTSSESEASSYGAPFYVFPKGNYELIWSKYIEDLYIQLFHISDEVTPKDYFKNSMFGLLEWSEITRSYFPSFGRSPDENIDKLIRSIFLMTDKDITDPVVFQTFKKEWEPKILDGIDNYLKIKIKSLYKKGDLKGSIKSENEVMIVCNEVVLVKANHLNTYIYKKFGMNYNFADYIKEEM